MQPSKRHVRSVGRGGRAPGAPVVSSPLSVPLPPVVPSSVAAGGDPPPSHAEPARASHSPPRVDLTVARMLGARGAGYQVPRRRAARRRCCRQRSAITGVGRACDREGAYLRSPLYSNSIVSGSSSASSFSKNTASPWSGRLTCTGTEPVPIPPASACTAACCS